MGFFSSCREWGWLCSCSAWASLAVEHRLLRYAASVLAAWGLSSCGSVVPQHVESSQIRDRTCVSCIGGQILYHWAIWEAPGVAFLIFFLNCSLKVYTTDIYIYFVVVVVVVDVVVVFGCSGSLLQHAGFLWVNNACRVIVAHGLMGLWTLPGRGLKPMSPALTAGFLSTIPPGKSETQLIFYIDLVFCYFVEFIY